MRHASIQTTMNSYGRATITEAKHKMNSNIVKMALRPLAVEDNSNRSSGPGEQAALLFPRSAPATDWKWLKGPHFASGTNVLFR